MTNKEILIQKPPDPAEFTDPSPNPANDAELAALCDHLRERDIEKITIMYDGSGDSGGVERIEFEPAGANIPDLLDDQLRDLAEGYCPDGYENNDGGYGTLLLHISPGLAELEHFDRFGDSESMHVETSPLTDELKQLLAQAGITHLTARFDGFGDSGQIETITAEPEGIEISDELSQKLDDFLLEQLPGGWEINAGSFGEFDIDVHEETVTVDANWRTEETSSALTKWKWRP